MQDKYISLARGNGGVYMRELIEELFAYHLGNPDLDVRADVARLRPSSNDILFTTGGFTVQPPEFPGGDIGSLAVHGTTNDLAVSGAKPMYLSLNAFIEGGMEIAQLERIISSLTVAAKQAGVVVAAGDTKVLPRGEGGGLYLATTGIGIRQNSYPLGLDQIQVGDKLLVSGSVGDHGITVMLAREQFGLRGDLQSDSASVLPFTECLLDLPGLRFMRDPTRGGLATVCHELNRATGFGVQLQQDAIPIHEPVQSVCDMLGYDPLFLACEGRVVAVVAASDAGQALERWKQTPGGDSVAIIGEFETSHTSVVLETPFGGERILEELEDDPLPRIC